MEENHTATDRSEALRTVMRNWASGVAIVTSSYNGNVHGMTVNSLHSVSLDPPLVVVTLAKNTRTHSLVSQSMQFGVSILSGEQQWISDRFSGKSVFEDNRFLDVPVYYLSSEIPLIDGSLASMVCTVIQKVDLSHSTLFFGEVEKLHCCGKASPLVYFNRSYHSLEG